MGEKWQITEVPFIEQIRLELRERSMRKTFVSFTGRTWCQGCRTQLRFKGWGTNNLSILRFLCTGTVPYLTNGIHICVLTNRDQWNTRIVGRPRLAKNSVNVQIHRRC